MLKFSFRHPMEPIEPTDKMLKTLPTEAKDKTEAVPRMLAAERRLRIETHTENSRHKRTPSMTSKLLRKDVGDSFTQQGSLGLGVGQFLALRPELGGASGWAERTGNPLICITWQNTLKLTTTAKHKSY